MLQNATPLRKSAPWPPNSCDEHVSCIALQMSHACHRFWKCHKTLTFCRLLTRSTIPCACHAKRHLNLQKWSEHVVFWTLCATSACTFSTSKSGPDLVCFVHFHFEMCFAPQRRALFRHRNFQKWSDAEVFCTFWLRNVLRATTACTFSTSQIPTVVRTWGALYILTWKSASRHNGVQLFTSYLARCFRTRRFSEPTFRPSGATKCFATFLPFRAPASSFFWLFLFSDLLSSALLFPWSSHHCFYLSILSEVWLLNFLR